MNPADYLRSMDKYRRKAFVLTMSRHPLLRHSTQGSINSTISQIIYGKVKKCGLHYIVAWEDVTKGEVTWEDWVRFTFPVYATRKRPIS